MEFLKRAFPFKDEGKKALSGYAFKFNERATGGFGTESFSGNLKVDFNPDGVFLLRDHDPKRILGRKGAGFEIETDEAGLRFSLEKFPETELGKETRELIKDKILNGASVGFSVKDKTIENRVTIFTSIQVHEISIVPWPYYKSSELKARMTKLPGVPKRHLPPSFYM